MIHRLTLIALLLILTGCNSYPRYRKYTPVTPEQQMADETRLPTNSYLRFGLFLQKYLGQPHSSNSRSAKALDCSGLVQRVYREYNKTILPRSAAEQHKKGIEVPRQLARFGDLVFFETVRGKISHVGIYIEHNQFVHVSTSQGVIISSLDEPYWVKRYRGIRRVVEL